MEHCKIVLTTQCNLDCRYCKSHSGNGKMADRTRILAACRQAAASGVSRFQLAGGEPLLYEDVSGLVGELKAIPGVEWVSLTTNGTLLYPQLRTLKEAGLDGINLHLDACDAFTFTNITGKSQLLNEILRGIWGAVAQEIPLTISAVLLEDNAATLAVVAGLAKQYDLTIRFVRAPIQSGEEGPDQKKALEILSKTIKGMEFDGNAYRAPGLKGSITFGENLWGAFGMEQGGVLSFEEE